MIYIFWAMIVGACLTIANIYYVSKSYEQDGFEMFSVLFGIISGTVTLFLLGFFSLTCWNWYSAEYQAKIINSEYGTNYTREDVLYASNVIDTIQQINRNRVEINGNVMGAATNTVTNTSTNTETNTDNASFDTSTDVSFFNP